VSAQASLCDPATGPSRGGARLVASVARSLATVAEHLRNRLTGFAAERSPPAKCSSWPGECYRMSHRTSDGPWGASRPGAGIQRVKLRTGQGAGDGRSLLQQHRPQPDRCSQASLEQRLSNFEGRFDENLRKRTQRAVLEDDDSSLSVRGRKLNGKNFDRSKLALKFEYGMRHDCKKPSRSNQFKTHVDSIAIDRRAGRLNASGAKCLNDQLIGQRSRRRPRPRLIHQVGQPDPATACPRIFDPSHYLTSVQARQQKGRCVMRRQTRVLLGWALVAAVFAQLPSAVAQQTRASGDAVTVWNANAGVAATKACIAPIDNPFHESRIYAMMHVAIHDALNAIDRRFHPYTFDKQAESGASPDAAVASAARGVLVPLLSQLPLELVPQSCIDAGLASVEAAYASALGPLPENSAKAQGIAVGQAAAAAILALRAADGAVGPFLNSRCPQAQIGKYQCTPGFPVVAFEAWEKVTPFVLQDNAQFRPGSPYTVTEPRYATDFNEVKTLGGDGSTTTSARTADQTEIALFWYESSPLKWSRIARAISVSKGLDLWQNARLFGLLNVALADGYIAMAASKNHYSYWRPVTAIRAAEMDGNPDTTGDPAWTPLRPTPPDQDYPSGHSIEGGAAAEVLKQFFGTDQISFQDCGVTLPAGST
jgi:hypothetical protein